MTFEIKPLVGIGPIQFGMTQDEVRDILTRLGGGQMKPRSPGCDTYFDAAFQVSFDTEGRTEFIETARHLAFPILFDGHALHELPAEMVVELVSKLAPGQWEERKHTYIVASHQLAFWRAVTPEPDQSAQDDEGRYFDAVGAGREGYFSVAHI